MSPRWGFKVGFILFSIHMSPRWGYESGKMPRLRGRVEVTAHGAPIRSPMNRGSDKPRAGRRDSEQYAYDLKVPRFSREIGVTAYGVCLLLYREEEILRGFSEELFLIRFREEIQPIPY